MKLWRVLIFRIIFGTMFLIVRIRFMYTDRTGSRQRRISLRGIGVLLMELYGNVWVFEFLY